MERAFEAHTLMRKDGESHLRERNALMPTFAPNYIKNYWLLIYDELADDYLDLLPKNEAIDLFETLSGPIATKMVGEMMGIPNASDEDLQHWSQALIDEAGNFGYSDEPFARARQANVEINACILSSEDRLRAATDASALSVMINVDDPTEYSQIITNIKIAIGGGINDPRNAFLAISYGLLTNPDQLAVIKETQGWELAFQEVVRWVAPIQVSGCRQRRYHERHRHSKG